MSKVEEVHPERIKWIEFDPVPIDTKGPVAWDDTKKSYASHRVRLRVRLLGIRERVEAFAEDVLQQRTPSAVCYRHDIWTSLVPVLVNHVANPRHHIQGHPMLGCEEHLPKAHRVRVPMAPHRDRVRRITARREIFQEESVFCCSSETTMDEEEGRFGRVVTDGCSAEELEIASWGGDVDARGGMVEFDVEPEVCSGRPLDAKQRHVGAQGRG